MNIKQTQSKIVLSIMSIGTDEAIRDAELIGRHLRKRSAIFRTVLSDNLSCSSSAQNEPGHLVKITLQ